MLTTLEIPRRQVTSSNSDPTVWKASSPRTTLTWSSVPMNALWMASRDSQEEHWLLSFLLLIIAESTRTLELFWSWRLTTRSFLRWSILPTVMRTIGLRMRNNWEGGLRLRQDGGKDIDLQGFIFYIISNHKININNHKILHSFLGKIWRGQNLVYFVSIYERFDRFGLGVGGCDDC